MTSFFRPYLLILVAVALIPFGCRKAEDSTESQTAIITVGKRVITVDEYDEALGRLIAGELEGADDEERVAIKEAVIAQLIDEALILDEAIKLGLTVGEEELAEEVAGIREAAEDESFEATITEQYGTMEKWNDEIRRKIMIRKCIEKVIGPKVDVTEETAQAYYNGHLKDYTIPRQVHARMILVESEEKARSIRKTLTPKKFADVAREVSLSPERASGGDLGFFGRGEMPKEFEDVVFNIKVGVISRIIKTGYGYHIFLVEARRRGGRLKFSEVKDRIMERLREEKGEAEFNDWIISLKEDKRIEIKERLL